MDIDRLEFVLRLPLVLTVDSNSGDAPEIIIGIFSRTVDHQICFLVHEILSLVFAHLRIWSQLNGVSGARFFAVATKDAAGEIDAKELRISSAMLVFSCLERDARHRTCHGAKVAGYTTFSTVGIAGENNSALYRGARYAFCSGY